MLQTEDQVLPVMQEKRALKRQKEEAAYNLMFQKYAQQPLPPVEQGEGDVLDGEDSQDSPRLGLEQTMEDGEDSQDSPRLGLEQMETQIKSIVTSRSRGVSFAPDLPFARDYTPDLDIRSHCRSSIQTVDMESEEMLKEWTLNKSNNFNDSKSNRSFINSFRRRKETVLEGNSLVKRAWMEYLFYIGLALVIQMSLGRDFAFPDGRPACDNKFGSSTTNRLMCDLVWTLERAQGQLRFLAPFILGGFVVGTVQLWRLRRTAYAALCGATRNMNIQIASLVPLNSEDEKSVNARAMMARWSLLGYEFSVLKARGQMDTLDAKKHLQSLGLLADGEWEAMVSGDRHTTVWLWLQVKAVQLGEQKIITSDIHVQTICNAVTLIRDKANDMMSVIDRDQPFPYTSVCGILVNFNLLLTALWKGVVSWFLNVLMNFRRRSCLQVFRT
jgi:hypothetical protein